MTRRFLQGGKVLHAFLFTTACGRTVTTVARTKSDAEMKARIVAVRAFGPFAVPLTLIESEEEKKKAIAQIDAELDEIIKEGLR